MFYAVKPQKGYGESRVKGHLCSSEELAQAVAADLTERFGEDFDVEEAEAGHIDYGGMIWLKGLLFQVDVGDSTVTVAADQANTLLNSVHRKLRDEPRVASGLSYIKCHGRFWCLCLTEGESNQLADGIQRAQAWEQSTMQELGRLPNADDFPEDLTQVVPGVRVKLYDEHLKNRG